MPIINHIREVLMPDVVCITQDYHPANHVSYASTHKKEVFSEITLPDGTSQMLWPDHCQMGTHGSGFHPKLVLKLSDYVIQKGTLTNVDSYSGFGAEDKSKDTTELESILRQHGVDRVVVVGLAFDYCVAYTAIDAAHLGFDTIVVSDACKATSQTGYDNATERMKNNGVKIVNSIEELICV
jgi:nicotinamidase/pyrazinamidase